MPTHDLALEPDSKPYVCNAEHIEGFWSIAARMSPLTWLVQKAAHSAAACQQVTLVGLLMQFGLPARGNGEKFFVPD